jgi:spore photoproduct lyase
MSKIEEGKDMSRKKRPDDEERLEDHEAEMAATVAETELREEAGRAGEREYQRMAADLRWEVMEYLDAHPDRNVIEVAKLFGLREGTLRAWKAHRTMGTYSNAPAAGAAAAGPNSAPTGAAPAAKPLKPRSVPLFKEKREPAAPAFLERKRFSNFIHYFDQTPPGIVCPHFYVLAHANGCPYACDYCYLRLTLRHYPEPTVFTNTARMFQELRDWLLSREEPSVLNAGELSDSLAWDRDTGLTQNLVPLFESQKKHKLLLLTKSTNVEGLLRMDPTPQVIVSFSINAPAVARRYERGAPPAEARLAAAKKLREAGWEVRLRLDPVLPVEGWQDHYGEAVAAINTVKPAVVTLGSLRFFKTLVSHAPRATDVFGFGRDHQDPDQRLRLPEEQRVEMYRFCIERLENLRVGLCKETESVHKMLSLPAGRQSCNCTVE